MARNSGLTTIAQGTFLGGGGAESVAALAIDGDGNVLAAGGTSSADLPGLAFGARATLSGTSDGFVTRLTPSLALAAPVAPSPPRDIPALHPGVIAFLAVVVAWSAALAMRPGRRSR